MNNRLTQSAKTVTSKANHVFGGTSERAIHGQELGGSGRQGGSLLT